MSTELDAKVVEFVEQVVTAMGLSVASEIEETPDHVRVNLFGDDAEVLLQSEGDPLDALQVIVNTAFRRDARGDRHYLIDALGFRKEKDAELRRTVQTLMEKVRSTGEPHELGPLNPYDRRIIHLTVALDEALVSESLGDDFTKIVVVSLKSA